MLQTFVAQVVFGVRLLLSFLFRFHDAPDEFA